VHTDGAPALRSFVTGLDRDLNVTAELVGLGTRDAYRRHVAGTL
jgi:hypothetical protein